MGFDPNEANFAKTWSPLYWRPTPTNSSCAAVEREWLPSASHSAAGFQGNGPATHARLFSEGKLNWRHKSHLEWALFSPRFASQQWAFCQRVPRTRHTICILFIETANWLDPAFSLKNNFVAANTRVNLTFKQALDDPSLDPSLIKQRKACSTSE